MELTIGHFRSLRTRWHSVICAFGSREEFCDRNTFDRPTILTGLRRHARHAAVQTAEVAAPCNLFADFPRTTPIASARG
jgi:hypothetical protein